MPTQLLAKIQVNQVLFANAGMKNNFVSTRTTSKDNNNHHLHHNGNSNKNNDIYNDSKITVSTITVLAIIKHEYPNKHNQDCKSNAYIHTSAPKLSHVIMRSCAPLMHFNAQRSDRHLIKLPHDTKASDSHTRVNGKRGKQNKNVLTTCSPDHDSFKGINTNYSKGGRPVLRASLLYDV